MQYLFFDLEKATSKKGGRICEFGYVIVDENFKIIEANNLIINPNISDDEWDNYVVKNLLHKTIEEYNSQPQFNHYYQKISNLILSADYVFGHSLHGDVSAINTECGRYSLPSINFVFYEIAEFYMEIENTDKVVSVSSMLKALKITGETLEHDAENDAHNTMLILQSLLGKAQVSVQDLIKQCPNAKLENKDFKVKTQFSNVLTKNQPHASASIGQLLGNRLAGLHLDEKN